MLINFMFEKMALRDVYFVAITIINTRAVVFNLTLKNKKVENIYTKRMNIITIITDLLKNDSNLENITANNIDQIKKGKSKTKINRTSIKNKHS